MTMNRIVRLLQITNKANNCIQVDSWQGIQVDSAWLIELAV